MPDYTKQCWLCGKVTMVNKGDYSQCSNCGTTWNGLPQPTSIVIKRGSISWMGDDNKRHRTPAYHITKRAEAKAAKARADKGGKQ